MMNEVMVYGVHSVTILLKNKDRKIFRLLVSAHRESEVLSDLVAIARERGIPVESLTLVDFKARFPNLVHQGVVAFANEPPNYTEADLKALLAFSKTLPLILILDGVTDPHNLGACLRTADAAGVDFVIIPKDKSAKITPVVSKVASGAAEILPLVTVTNLVRTMRQLKAEGIWVYGAAPNAPKMVYEERLNIPLAVVLGAEGRGLRRLTIEACDGLFSLPMQGSVQSLNVSVATGILLYEAVRQRIMTHL